MTTSEKKKLVYKLYERLTIVKNLGSPINFFNIDSDDYLDEKIKVLTKMVNGEELTKEEKYSKKVFEEYPEGNNEGLIIG